MDRVPGLAHTLSGVSLVQYFSQAWKLPEIRNDIEFEDDSVIINTLSNELREKMKLENTIFGYFLHRNPIYPGEKGINVIVYHPTKPVDN